MEKSAGRPPVRFRSYALSFFLIAAFLILAHASLLDLPFYWDELGQFIPAALDIFRAGEWIPVSTVPNVHPPGVMAYLAMVWSIFGYSIAGTRVAMLIIAALGALVTFLLGIQLSRGAAGAPAFTALALLCLSPLFFAQSMMAQLDMPAMVLATLALLFFLQERRCASAIACAVLVLVKETGAVVPALFGVWLIVERRDWRNSAWFLLPFPGLILWLVALHQTTGHWLGNAAFTEYNVRDSLEPVHFLLAAARRFYYVFIGSGHFIGTLALIWAWRRMPLLRERAWRISWMFVLVQLLVVSAFGGATLERYVLPVLPVVYVAFALSLRALKTRTRQIALAALIVCLIGASFVNPPYPFPFENNLAFVSFVRLEQSAASEVEQYSIGLPGGGVVATAFPLTSALRNPDFGFVGIRHKVLEVRDFTRPEIERLRLQLPDLVVVYQRTWDPLDLLAHPAISSLLTRWYGYERELTPNEIAGLLGMRVARQWTRRGLSIELLER